MAYGRKSYRSARGRKPAARKYARKGRSRFSRKRFTKVSSKQKTVISAPVNARETYVKLPWVNTFSSTSLTTGTSSGRAFLGNSLVPFPASYASNSPAAGDEWVSGVSQYSAFYNLYRVLGSSIKVQVICQTQSGFTFGFAIVPIATFGDGSALNSVTEKIAELDALSYDAVTMLPNAKCRMVGIGSGGNANVFYKMFRKTKAMIGCKDIKDVEDTQCELPSGAGAGGSIICASVGTADSTGTPAWFYYVRVFNLTGSTGSFDMQVKMKYYTQLFGRTIWSPLTAT